MKPRLVPISQTKQDAEIWDRIAVRAASCWNVIADEYFIADRRDADLMLDLTLEESRRHYLNLRRYALRIGGTTLDWPDWPKGELP